MGLSLITSEDFPLHKISTMRSRDSVWSWRMLPLVSTEGFTAFLWINSPTRSLLKQERRSIPLKILLFVLKENKARSSEFSRKLSFLIWTFLSILTAWSQYLLSIMLSALSSTRVCPMFFLVFVKLPWATVSAARWLIYP